MFRVISVDQDNSPCQAAMDIFIKLQEAYGEPLIASDKKQSYVVEHSHYGVMGCFSVVPDLKCLNNVLNFTALKKTLYSGWVVTDLFFELNEEAMDGMDDSTLKRVMQEFYKAIYDKLWEIRSLHDVPYMCVVTNQEQHAGAQWIGLFPFKYVLTLHEPYTDFVLAFLNMDEASRQLFVDHYTCEQAATHTPCFAMQ